MGQLGLFDVADRLESLSRMGNQLQALREQIPWEGFRGLLKGRMRGFP